MIPLTKDVSALVGDWAEGVDNRSLLHEKFALPKAWGGKSAVILNDAGRWSVLRIVSRGDDLLRNDARRLRREASGPKTRPDIAERKEGEAHVAEKMANIAKGDPTLASVAIANSRHLLTAVERSFPGRVATFEATLAARMMVNLAGGVVENAGIALDRCFGLPLIPGSAVKGICRAQALWEIREAKGDEKARLLLLAMVLFGYGAQDLKPKGDFGWAGGLQLAEVVARRIDANDFGCKGCACFMPAYPTKSTTLVVDIVNPHYPEYYRGKRPHAEDNESPVPNYFPAVEAGSSFGFVVLLNRVPSKLELGPGALLSQAKSWLERAVTRKGVGAKTAAGYGWFEIGVKRAEDYAGPPSQSKSTALPVAQPAAFSPADQLIARFKNLNTKDNFPAALPALAELEHNSDLQRAFDTLVPAHERARLRKSNPYWQAFTSGKAAAAGQKILIRLGLKLT